MDFKEECIGNVSFDRDGGLIKEADHDGEDVPIDGHLKITFRTASAGIAQDLSRDFKGLDEEVQAMITALKSFSKQSILDCGKLDKTIVLRLFVAY